jgi:hypothetical protein
MRRRKWPALRVVAPNSDVHARAHTPARAQHQEVNHSLACDLARCLSVACPTPTVPLDGGGG